MRKRYVQIGGELVEVSKDYVQVRHATDSHNIIPDIQPYQSMQTGELIGGRRQHREHLRQHGLVEIGNEVDKMRPWGTMGPSIDWKSEIRKQMARRGMI